MKKRKRLDPEDDWEDYQDEERRQEAEFEQKLAEANGEFWLTAEHIVWFMAGTVAGICIGAWIMEWAHREARLTNGNWNFLPNLYCPGPHRDNRRAGFLDCTFSGAVLIAT